MSKFSDTLDEYIMHAGLSENQLAAITGFSRSYIARMKNGQRVSPDVEKMEKMFGTLNLNSAEYAELWNLYLQERQGKENYNLTKAVLEFVSSFQLVSKLSIDVKLNYEIPDMRVLKGSQDIIYMIKLLIKQEAARENGMLRLLIQPECGGVMETLLEAFKINRNLKVEHLVCLENRGEREKSKYYNLGIFKKIIPVILCGENVDYKVYYHYDSVASHFNQFSMFPYAVIVSDRIININDNFEHAIVHTEKDVLKFYTDIFDEMTKECERLYMPVPKGDKLEQYYNHPEKIVNNVYTVKSQPCFGFLEVTDLFQKYINQTEKKGIGLYEWLNTHKDSIINNNHKMVSYFTENGMRRFVEDGKVDEFSEVLEQSDRQMILKELIRLAKKGFYEPRLIREGRYHWPEEVGVLVYNFGEIAIDYNVNSRENSFVIQEKSLAKILYEFMEHFGESTYVCSKEETLQYLKQFLE